MRKNILIIFCLFACSGCYVSTMLSTEIPTVPTYELKPLPSKIVVANLYDIKKALVRNNKEKLFAELINLTMRHISNEISRRGEMISSFKEGLTVQGDSSIKALMTEQLASHAIMIKSFDSYFQKGEVVVTQSDQGKSRQAHYDMIVDIGYSLYDWNGHKFDTLISLRKYHSSRSVLSGLLAAGPNIVSNSSDATEGIFANVDAYLKIFFKGFEKRTRHLFISKDFEEMKNAIAVSNYEQAFIESEKLISADKKTVAAMAALNCAVLLEYLGQYERVKFYLETSLSLRKYSMPETSIMLRDYRGYKSIP